MRHLEVGALVKNYEDKSLNELSNMEEAIKLARKRKEEMKRDSVPDEDVEILRAVWKVTELKQRVEIPITLVIEVAADSSDSCGVYPSIVSPEMLSDWDAYDALYYFPKRRAEVEDAIEALKGSLDKANRMHREFEKKHDVPASAFLK